MILDKDDGKEIKKASAILAEECRPLFEHLAFLAQQAIADCKYLSDCVVRGEITCEKDIGHVLDRMLDFIEHEEMQALFKKTCRAIIYDYPEFVYDYVMIYKERTTDAEKDEE